MKQWTGPCTGAVCAFLLGTTALHAEMTAEQVWTGMTGYYTSLGQKVTSGSESREGDTLVIRDAVFSSSVPEGEFSMELDEVRLRELGDGRVEMTFSETVPFRTLTRPKDAEPVTMEMSFTQSGFAMIASGTPEDTSYEFAAPMMGFAVDTLLVDGAKVPLVARIAVEGSSGGYRMQTAAERQMTSSFSANKIDFEVSAQNPEGEGDVSASGSFTGLSGNSEATIPLNVNMTDMNAALAAGLAMSGDFSATGGGYVMDLLDGSEASHIQSTGSGGKLHFKLAEDGLAYGGEGGPMEISMQVSAFPLPIEVSLGSQAFDLVMPVAKGDGPQPFSLLLKIADLEVSEMLWSLFDPQSQLPRDPATLLVDIGGEATMKVNIFDPKEAEAMAGTPPGDVHSLDLRALNLSAVGAELTGTGAFTFDNAMGMPKPVGSVDLQLVGGNALIDKLVAMGLVPSDQAMGARMMMGLFAVPTGEDTLTSKIEVREDGHVFANGQQIQ